MEDWCAVIDKQEISEMARERFRQDTLKAWEAYRTTGLHVTAGEADAWLVRLEQGSDIDPPKCHV
jgi:predicted transcriptional regulator